MPLPGVKVGEIGPKLGFNTVNNGFLGFENVRIPRDMMLMKNAQVLKVFLKYIFIYSTRIYYFTLLFVLQYCILFKYGKILQIHTKINEK